MIEKRICMVGCFESGLEIIRYLKECGVKVTHIVTISPELSSKHNVSGYVDYRSFSEKHDIELYFAKRYDLKCEQDLDYFKSNQFDLLFIGGWNRLIPSEVLSELSFGGIGVHGSPEFLPMGRGRSPMNWALIEGKTRFIMHLFKLAPGIDDGDIIEYGHFQINCHDTIKTLYMKYSIVVKRMLGECIPKILDGSVELTAQVGAPEYYPKRTPEDGAIDWEKSDLGQIYNFIRAQSSPYPGAFIKTVDGKLAFPPGI